MKKANKVLSLVLSVLLLTTSCMSALAEETISESLVQTTNDVSGALDADGKFYPDYNTVEEAYAASLDTVKQVASEGYVLLKNENGALPLAADEKYVTLLGVASAYVQYSGGGSGAGYPGSYGIPLTTIREGVENGGYIVNPKADSFYTNNYDANSLEPGPDVLSEIEGSFSNFGDAAIVTIKRTGSEGSDLKMSNVEGHSEPTDHYLMLDDNEKALIRYAKAHFPKVIVLINSANVMELGDLAAEKTDDNLGVDAILVIGHVGNNGACAIGEVLNGTVNPSGHTVDTWAYDFTKHPSYNNFGTMTQNGEDWNNNLYLDGEAYSAYHEVEYREDIYVGYKYYETVCAEKNLMESGSGDTWYEENVLYPFGYGLSYTTFEWELTDAVALEAPITAANETITVQVKVTNTGNVAGKDVVELYTTPPYELGGIEKADVNLMGFAKTKLLQPGESEVVTIEFVAQDMASFDWNDANGNDFNGYELEAGDYTISLRRNSHDEVLSVTRTIAESMLCETDYTTGKEIQNLFSATEGVWADYNTTTDALTSNLLSRANIEELPAASTPEDRTITQEFIDEVQDHVWEWSYEDSEEDYWYVSSVPSTWTQSSVESPLVRESTAYRGGRYIAERVDGSKTEIQLSDMTGVHYDDYTIVDGQVVVGQDEGSQKWEEFLNQLTFNELVQIVSSSGYTRPQVDSISKLLETDPDGPAQLATMIMFISGVNTVKGARADGQLGAGTLWPTAYLMACTWNTDLLYEAGRCTGNEALLLHCNGWYGPGMNIHRSPFGGRNFEYYSEDGVMAGKMAAAIVKGATDKGIVCYIKHLGLNEQETNRGGLFTYATEQAIREIYLKPFEIAIKEGHAMGTMNVMPRLGNIQGYSNGALHDGLLRYEWDFKGITLTDAFMDNANGNKHQMAGWHNGVDQPLAWSIGMACGIEQFRWDSETNMVYVAPDGEPKGNEVLSGLEDSETLTYDESKLTMASPTLYYVIRRAALHVLYVSANTSGNFNAWTTKNVETVQLTKAENTSVTAKTFKNYKLENVAVTSGELPEGITISDTGVVTVNADAPAGTYTVEIECLVDSWIGNINSFTYNGQDYTLGSRVNGTLTIEVAEPAKIE